MENRQSEKVAEKIEKCQYCHEDAEGYSTMFGAFWIRNSVHEGWLLHAGKCKPRPINHCPICGRRLEKYVPR